jgi:alpha-tubulin suppressor-like RCC1 family protein
VTRNAKISKFSEFFLGCDYTLAIDSVGFVWGWGHNYARQLAVKSEVLNQPKKILEEPVEAVATGMDHTLVMTKNGDVYGWGCAAHGQLGFCESKSTSPKKIEFPGNSPVVFILCGECNSVVMTMDGSIYLLGRPIYGTTNSDQNLKVYYPEIRFRIPMQFRDKLWSKVIA